MLEGDKMSRCIWGIRPNTVKPNSIYSIPNTERNGERNEITIAP